MNDETQSPLDRLTELLADHALFGLDDAEQRELDALLANTDAQDNQSLEYVAASAQLATLGQMEKLPVELAQKLAEQGHQTIATTAGSPEQIRLAQSTGAFPRRELLAWFAAAAAVGFALFAVTREPQSPTELRAELLALASTSSNADKVTQVAWSLGEDPTSKNASGDVVWHNGRQQGVMKFNNLAANDPTKTQYQLWIFDSAQDERFPVDGGVFDVPVGAKEVLIKIDAKLPIVDPTLFAITVEKPGGVVVSSRERLPLLAKVE